MYENKPLFIEYDLKDSTSRRTFGQGKSAFKNGQVLSITLQGTTISGEVRENDLTVYQTRLHSDNGKITSNCSCPHNWEPVCKHAVALGFAYLNKVNQINVINQKKEPDYVNQEPAIPQENLFLNSIMNTLSMHETHKDKTALILHIDTATKRFSVFFYDKETREIIHSPDWYLAEKDTEKNLMQQDRTFIEYFTQQESVKFFIPSRYYPIEKYLYTIPLMFSGLRFYNKDTGSPVSFSDTPLSLKLHLTLEDMEYLKIKPYWHNRDVSLELHEGLHIKGIRSFVFYDNTFYPILNPVHEDMAFHFLLNKNSEFYSNEIPRILLEILPKIEEKGITVDKDQSIGDVSVLHADARPLLRLTSEKDALRAGLFFNYGEFELASNPNRAERYYYVHRNEVPTYVTRDIAKEHECGQFLIRSGFEFEGSNQYTATREQALDFIRDMLPLISGEWIIVHNDLPYHTVHAQPVQLQLQADAGDREPFFTLTLQAKLGTRTLRFAEIKKHINDKKKYYQLEDSIYAAIHTDDFLHVLQTLKKLGAERKSDTCYRLPLYQGYFLYNEFRDIMKCNEPFLALVEKLNAFENIPPKPVPERFAGVLRDYQKAGFYWLNFLKDNNLSGILADDMGLGKTVQALSIIEQEYNNGHSPMKSIIVAPTSTIFNWEQEFAKFAPGLRLCVYTGQNRKRCLGHFNEYDVILTSFAILRKDFGEFNEEFHYCIIDEAQYIKNFRSQTAKTVKKIKARHKLALTGTPIENNLSELWSIFDFLMPRYLFSYDVFKKMYEDGHDDIAESTTISRLRKRINPFILRRIKGNVARELPPKVENYLYTELLDEQQALYNEYLEVVRNDIFKKVDSEGIAGSHISILAALMKLRQICCHPKLTKQELSPRQMLSSKFEQFKETVTEIIAENHKVLIFSQFVEMLDIIRAWLIKKNIPFEYLTGSTKNKKAAVNNFNNNPDIPIFLISLKAGGVGINLTSADYVIHYDPWWNPAVEAQATDRTHRIGQTKTIFCYKMITKNTIEERILNLQARKQDLINTVITSESGFAKALTRQDLEYLLSL